VPATSAPRSAPKISEPVVSVPQAAPKPVAKPVAKAAPQPQIPPVEMAQAEVAALPKLALATLEPGQWIDLFHQLPLTGVARNIAANSVVRDVNGANLTLVLEEGKATLYNDEHRKRIESVLADYFTTAVQLRVDIGAVGMETPAAWRQRREAERKEAARKAFTEDALVRAVVERFGAEIQLDSITSLASDKLH
jgi:DNA polymerase-3 subunit gamma/tau